MADTLKKTYDDLEHGKQKADRAAGLSRGVTRQILLNRWPILFDRSTPLAQQTITTQQDKIIAMLESSLSYERLRKHLDESDKLDDDAGTTERSWVKCRRFINTAESVALAANLPTVASKEIQERYHQLIVSEDAASPRSMVSAEEAAR